MESCNQVHADSDFCKKLPKVELHAHLNGSVSRETIDKLQKLYGPDGSTVEYSDLTLEGKEKKDYTETFNVFDAIYRLVTSLECIEVITQDIIQEFYDDNVFYLEIRSTPKCLKGKTKRDYLNTVIKVMQAVAHPDMVVAFLVSIDREKGVEDSKENVDLAIEYNKLYPEIVLGVDFSGIPTCGDVNDYLPLFRKVKENGMMLALHIGEVRDTKENLTLLQASPDRAGHCVYIHPDTGGDQVLFDEIRRNQTPIEMCLSSNVIAGLTTSYIEHPFIEWYKIQHPMILCTDDKGLFNTTPSKEYALVSEAFQLSKEQVARLSFNAIDHIASSDAVKNKLKKLWKTKLSELHISGI